MSSQLSFLNVETLNQISFDRSKKWGSFFDKYKNSNESIEIPVNQLLKYHRTIKKYKDDEEYDSSESDNDSGAEIDIEAMLDKTCKNVKSKAECTYHRVDKDRDEDDDEKLEDVLNATLPVLVEHKLQCKRAGIDRILDTFDTNKIERKVGGWLRRNQSGIIGSNSTEISSVAYNHLHPCQEFSKLSCIESESDSDSLHSFDTARYIKASKKNRESLGRCLSSGCNSTTIKTYRTSQTKRDALREKYAMDERDKDVLYAKESRRRQCHSPQCITKKFPLLQSNQRVQTSRKNMHKQLLQHRDNDVDTSSTDSDESNQVVRKHHMKIRSTNLKGVREEMRCRSLAYVKRLHRQRINRTLSSSSSFMSTHSCANTKFRRHCMHCVTGKNCKCSCTNEPKSIRYTPTMKVENCIDSTKKHSCMPNNHYLSEHEINLKNYQRQNSKRKSKKTFSQTDIQDQCNFVNYSTKNADIKVQPKKRIQLSKTDTTKKKAKSTKKGMKIGKQATKKQAGADKSKLGDSTFEEHLQIAIQLSNDVYLKMQSKNPEEITTDKSRLDANSNNKNNITITEGKNEHSNDVEKHTGTKIIFDPQQSKHMNTTTEVKNNVNKNATKIKSVRTTTVKGSRRLTKTQTDSSNKGQEQENKINSDDTLDKNTNLYSKKQRELSAIDGISYDCSESNKQTKNVGNTTDCIVDDELTPEIKLKPQPKSAKLRKLHKLAERRAQSANIGENVFQKDHNFRNSTAFADDTAIKRQIFDATALSTHGLKHCKGRRLSLNVVDETTSNSNDRDEDCTVVSSTISDQQQSQCSSHTNSERILVYTPTKQDSITQKSLINDRFVITKEHLSTVIGERSAQKFLKYYVGRRDFNSQSRIYYRPPQEGLHTLECSDESDVDPLDLIDQCGDLCESFKKK